MVMCDHYFLTARKPAISCSDYFSFTLLHDFLKHLKLYRIVKGDEVHAAFTAEVATVEPVPVLELVPWFTPG